MAAVAPAFPPEIAFLDALVSIWLIVGTTVVVGGGMVAVADWRIEEDWRVEESEEEGTLALISSVSSMSSASVGVIATIEVSSGAATALFWKNALRHE